MSIFSTYNGKTNKVGKKHARRAVLGALKSLFSSDPYSKNSKRGGSIDFSFSKKYKR